MILKARGVEDASNGHRLNEYLDVLLSQHPELLRSAAKEAMAATAEIRDAREIPKMLAEHASYGKVVILTKDESSRWSVAEIDRAGRACLTRQFRLFEAASF